MILISAMQIFRDIVGDKLQHRTVLIQFMYIVGSSCIHIVSLFLTIHTLTFHIQRSYRQSRVTLRRPDVSATNILQLYSQTIGRVHRINCSHPNRPVTRRLLHTGQTGKTFISRYIITGNIQISFILRNQSTGSKSIGIPLPTMIIQATARLIRLQGRGKRSIHRKISLKSFVRMTSHYNMYSTSLSIGILIGSRHWKHFNAGNIVRFQRTEIAYQHLSGKFYLPIIYKHLRAGRTIDGNPLVGQPYSGRLLKEFDSVFVLCRRDGQDKTVCLPFHRTCPYHHFLQRISGIFCQSIIHSHRPSSRRSLPPSSNSGKAGQYQKYQVSHTVSHLPDNTSSF